MKSEETIEVESMLRQYTLKKGIYGCNEVTLRNPVYETNKERVDFITFDNKGTVRCYEIKITKSDFHSKAHLSFWGDYNYLVITPKLFDKLHDDQEYHITIASGLGVITCNPENHIVKTVRKPSKKQVSISAKTQILESIAKSACNQLDNLHN